MGLAIGNWPINIRDIATVTLPTLNDGHNNSGSDYPGMVGVQVTGANGCSSSNCPQWSKVAYNPEGVGQNTGFAFPTNTKITLAGWNTFNTSHWPQPEFPAYLVTGEPQYRDLLLEQADTAIIQRNSPLNTSTINSTTVDWGGAPPGRNFVICSNPPTCSTTNSYYGVTLNSNNEIRKDAWAHAIAAEAAFVVSPESAGQSVHQYFNDIESQWASAYITFQNWEAAVNPWAGSVGLFNEATGELTPWTLYYFQGSVGYSYQLTLNSTEISVLNNLMLWPNYVDRITDPVSGARVGASFVAAYAYGVRPSPNDSTTQYQTSDKDGNGSWIVAPGNFGFTWSSSAGFTFTGSSGNWFGAGWSGYSPHAGDTVLFCGNYCGIGTAPPPNYGTMTPYFVNNVTATTFELAPYVAGSNGCNEQYQSGCVPLQYGSGSNTSNTAELYTSTIPFSLPACGTAPYSSGTCQSIATLIGEGGTGYNAIAYGNFMIGQAALNFYNCQVGSCTSGFSTGNSNNAQLYTDLQNMLQNDPVDFVSAYETIGGSKYATVPNP